MTIIQSIKWGLLAIFVACFFYYMPGVFRAHDCANATRALAHIEACEESGACMLTSDELKKKQVYIRLQAISCKKD